MLRAVKNCQAALSFRVALPFRDELMFPVVNYDSDAVMDLDVPLPPDESVHCADGRKNSGGNEPNQIRTTIRMERSLLSYPIRSRIMSEIISVPIETYVMKVRAIMCSTVSPIMIRQTEVEQTTIRIIHINPETPSSAGNINRAVEIISSQKTDDTVRHSIPTGGHHYEYPKLHNNHLMPIHSHGPHNP